MADINLLEKTASRRQFRVLSDDILHRTVAAYRDIPYNQPISYQNYLRALTEMKRREAARG